MFHTKVFWWVSWLAVLAWLISACGSLSTPAANEAAAQPTPIEEHQGEHEHEHEAEIEELEPVSLGAGEKLKVVATTNIVANVVSQVGGDLIELTQLLPIGADPHTYIATPQDIASVIDAHVIFANGADLEAEFLPELTQDTHAPVVFVSQGVEFRVLGTTQAEADTSETGEHRHEGIDPHTWTTPANVTVFVHNIKEALSALDPDRTATYEANAKDYTAELEALDDWVEAQIETIPADNRKLVTDHTVFGYYADRYGLEQIGAVIPAFSTAAEPSARDLAALEDVIRTHNVPAVFVGNTTNPALTEQVAQDTGVKLVALYTGSLGPEESRVDSYSAYMCYNTLAIVDALGGTPDTADSPCE